MYALMKRAALPIVLLAILAGGIYWYTRPDINPDPNHTHADFAVFVSGEKIDFSKAEYMSGSSTGSLADADHQAHDPYYHLHDGNGGVIHRHKPGLPLGQFFASLGFTMTADCFTLEDAKPVCNEGAKTWKMYVNGTEHAFSPAFTFADGDKLLLTYNASQSEVQRQLSTLSDSACLFSQTCPWKGDPPAENCISDPKVPCVE
jgi:hypothetical protein